MQCNPKIEKCQLANVVNQLRDERGPNAEADNAEMWAGLFLESETSGDEFGDYDGPLTWN